MKILRGIGIALLILAVIICGVYIWALTATGTSQLVRGILWGNADVDDRLRFPERPVRAGAEPASFIKAGHTPLTEVKVNGAVPLAEFLEDKGTTAFIVIHGDTLLYERYFNGSSREDIQTSFSVAKSFASALVGIAIGEGLISSLDDPVTVYVPELLEQDPRFADITLRHLITMTSGIRYRDWFSPWSDPATTYYAPDLRSAALSSRIEESPGNRFLYNNYNPLLIGMVLERATGMKVSEYLETRLWQPMGAEADASWSLDSERSGFEKMESGINGRAIDFTRFGWLFLNNGRNGDRQVVPAAWVEESTRVDTTTDPSANYQYFWWVDEKHNAYWAEGNYGQTIYVHPDGEFVFVRMGRQGGEIYWPELLSSIAEFLDPSLIE